ncbi:MAG: flagellin [Opitutae bacterium]|nr:flagellin [Opitutae bacterium]
MPLTINSNATASRASMHLNHNTEALRKSLSRLSSGSRITRPMDDAGGLAVSMKLESSITRLAGAHANVQNAISFLEVQDGVLESAGKVVNRMIELKGLSQDVMKNSSDVANYNREFQDLQVQLYEMTAVKFNGVSMFAQFSSEDNNAEGKFGDLALDNTISVFVSADGTTGPKVSVNKSMLLSALTIDAGTLAASEFSNAGTGDVKSFAASPTATAIDLSDVSVGVFTQALQNVATLRADNGSSMSRLTFASDNIATTKTNMEAAKGRITDVDIATESTRMAKYNVLVQASASMLAQANTSNDVALMLIR